jgi:hypothetical protein
MSCRIKSNISSAIFETIFAFLEIIEITSNLKTILSGDPKYICTYLFIGKKAYGCDIKVNDMLICCHRTYLFAEIRRGERRCLLEIQKPV